MQLILRTLALLAGVLSLAICLPLSAENREAAVARVTSDVSFLASDALEGRGVETAGNQKAADYVQKALENAGLQGGMPDGSYFQPFTVTLGEELKPEETHLKLGGEQALKLGEDFQPLYVGGAGDVEAPLVFAGYGISAPGLKYDDYAHADVKGKVLLILRKEPQQDNPHSAFDGTETTAHAYIRTKIQAAAEQGAAGVLIVNDSGTVKEEDGTDKLAKPGAFGDGATKIPFGQVTRAQVEALLKKSPLKSGDKTFDSLAAIESHIDETFAPMTQPMEGITADLQFAFDTREVGVVNVIAKIPGVNDDEFVVVGAHLDHIGYGGAGSRKPGVHEIHNGADDNASGTSAMIELARRAAAGPKPSRTIIFIGFNGEERGLLGSNYYVEHPVYPLENTIAMLNFDMVGRLGDNPLTVNGVGSATEFDEIIAKASEDRPFEVKAEDGVISASDHYSFFLKQIPSIHFFTGLTEQYHTPADDIETLNMAGIVNTVDVAEAFLSAVLVDEDGFEYVEAPTQSPGRGGDMAYFGVVPDYSGGNKGLKINGTGKESPAEKAGLQAGDVITKFGDLAIGDIQGLADGLRKYKPGDKVKVIVKRGDDELELEVELAPPRGSKK